MLMTVGEITVTAIDSQSYEVDKADEILSEVVRELCQESHFYNTEYDVTLSADGNSQYAISSNIVSFIPNSAGLNVTIRNGYLYNLDTGSDEFSEATITGKKNYLLDFDELPETAKRYATIRASRIFADRFVGSQGIRAFSLQDELEAKALFMQGESYAGRTNMIADSYSTIRTVLRRGGNINPERLY